MNGNQRDTYLVVAWISILIFELYVCERWRSGGEGLGVGMGKSVRGVEWDEGMKECWR